MYHDLNDFPYDRKVHSCHLNHGSKIGRRYRHNSSIRFRLRIQMRREVENHPYTPETHDDA